MNSTLLGWWTCSVIPDRARALRAPTTRSIPSAVEELLRFDTPLQMFERWVLEPIELHGSRSLVVRSSDCSSARRTATRRSSMRPDELRPGSRAEPAPHVRRGDPLLPGRTARADGAADVLPRAPRAVPDDGAARGAALEAELHHPWARGPAGATVTTTGSRAGCTVAGGDGARRVDLGRRQAASRSRCCRCPRRRRPWRSRPRSRRRATRRSHRRRSHRTRSGTTRASRRGRRSSCAMNAARCSAPSCITPWSPLGCTTP